MAVTTEELLRQQTRGEPTMTPEDTAPELLERRASLDLRQQMRGEPSVSPEDTRSELLADKARIAQEKEQKFEHYDFIESRDDVKYHAKTQPEIEALADRQGNTRFWGETANEERIEFNKIDGEWKMRDVRAEEAERTMGEFAARVERDHAKAANTPVNEWPQELRDAHIEMGSNPDEQMQTDAYRGIEERSIAGANAFTGRESAADPDLANKWVEADYRDYSWLNEGDRKDYAADAIAGNAADIPGYKSALDERYPAFAQEMAERNAALDEAISRKETWKSAEAEGMRQDRLDTARGMSDDEARSQAALDVVEHEDLAANGPKSDIDAYYLRNDMAERAQANATYTAALQAVDPELAKRVAENERENVRVDLAQSIGQEKHADRKFDSYGAAASDVKQFMETGENKEARKTIADEMQKNAGINPLYAESLEKITPNLSKVADGKTTDKEREDIYTSARSQTQKNERDNPEERDERERMDKSRAADDLVERNKRRETQQAMQGLNEVDVKRTGREIERDDLILPRRIANNYTEVDGKFFAKGSQRLMFEDKGDTLATSSTDKAAIADMVAYAKAKQWDSFKLSGAQEFRREAWLQAESQGIKTSGYTPRAQDLAALKELTQERQTNAITPVQERQKERTEPAQDAPRHSLNKNQAAMHDEATKAITGNIRELQKNPALAERSIEDLQKLAYWRGVVMEDNKMQPKPTQDEALARFDKLAADPQFVKKLEAVTEAQVNDKTSERAQDSSREQKRDTPELSL